MSSDHGSYPGYSGLSQSTPIVSMAGADSDGRHRETIPAGNDHPLAVSSPPLVQTKAAITPTVANRPGMISTPPMAPPQRTPSLGATSVLDAMADAFLAEPSYRTQQLGLAPLLRPLPLPRDEGVARLRTLVERRAWGDVLKISTNILNSPNEPHADVYGSLVMLPLNAPRIDVSSIAMDVRLETVEIMTLQCHAWLKLRRYADLAAEVERWNFVAQNDAAAQSPEWLPWGLRK